MSLEDNRKLEELQRETRQLAAKVAADQAKCQHDWTKEVYDPTTEKVGYGYRLIPELSHGSDPYYGYTGYEDKEKARWRRDCLKCGKIQYATERATKTVDAGPKFE